MALSSALYTPFPYFMALSIDELMEMENEAAELMREVKEYGRKNL